MLTYPQSSQKCLLFSIVLFLTLLVISSVLLGISYFRKRKVPTVDLYFPEQIHIALGDDNSKMVIIWSTASDPGESIVKYGSDCENLRHTTGHRKELDTDGRVQYIHYVTLTHLQSQNYYCYSVGSRHRWSKHYEFFTFPKGTYWAPIVALFGDMGKENGRAIPSLIANSINGSFDLIIDVGDIAYTLYAFKGRMGDAFMRAIEPFAARVPFMVVPGNHEYECYGFRCPSDGGLNYEMRFKMPKSSDNSHYTFKIGSALFIGISTEVYYEQEVNDLDSSIKQREWLENILYKANLPENRARYPWIIVYGHRPLYCSSQSDCYEGLTYFPKDGRDIVGSLYEIDDILYKYGVDIAFWGHEHNYERMFPVYNQTVYVNSFDEDAYINPRATVHFISGAAGMHSENEPFHNRAPVWSAFRSSAYGYTRFIIHNETHIYLEQIDVQHNDEVIDTVWIIQETHIPFPVRNRNLEYMRVS